MFSRALRRRSTRPRSNWHSRKVSAEALAEWFCKHGTIAGPSVESWWLSTTGCKNVHSQDKCDALKDSVLSVGSEGQFAVENGVEMTGAWEDRLGEVPELSGEKESAARKAVDLVVFSASFRADAVATELMCHIIGALARWIQKPEDLASVALRFVSRYDSVRALENAREKMVQAARNEEIADGVMEWQSVRKIMFCAGFGVLPYSAAVILMGGLLAGGDEFQSHLVAALGSRFLEKREAEFMAYLKNDLAKDEDVLSLLRTIHKSMESPNLKLHKFGTGDMKWIGFDLDQTLVEYNSETMLAMKFESCMRRIEETAEKQMIEQLHCTIQSIAMDDKVSVLAQKGLVIDSENVYLLQVDREKKIAFGFDGSRPLSMKQMIDAQYICRETLRRNALPIEQEQSPFSVLHTGFETPLAVVVAAIFDQLKPNHRGDSECRRAWLDIIQKSLIFCQSKFCTYSFESQLYHSNSPPTQLIVVHREASRWLSKHAKSKHHKLFIVTNASFRHLEATMTLVYGEVPWRKWFSVIVAEASKARFFHPSFDAPCQEIHGKDVDGRVFKGGSAKWIIENVLEGVDGSKILYVGDHMFQDVKYPHEYLGWNTVALLPRQHFGVLGESSPCSLLGHVAQTSSVYQIPSIGKLEELSNR